jgi:hypothetical protein
MDRLLTFVGIGAFGLLARFVQFAFSREQSGRLGAAYGTVAKLVAGALLVLHLGLAPVALTYRAANVFGPPKMVEALHLRTDLPEEAKNQDLIVVNPPSPFHVSYYLVTGELEGQVLPRRLRCLATGVTPMTVRREDPRTIVIRPRAGFMPMVLSRLVRNERHPMSVGEVVELTGMRVEVIETTSDGQPAAARFVFDVPLEDGSLRWLRWREGQFEEFHPPPVGEETTLTPPPLRRFVTGDYRP